MKESRATKLAYAAGFLDGEGCIRIQARPPRDGRSRAFSLLVQITQKDGRPIDWLYGNWGGMVYLKNKANDGSDWIYEWRVSERKAYEFLKEVLPFLIYKKEQAEVAVRFQERLIFARKKNCPSKKGFPYTPLTEHEIGERDELHQQICLLKRQFQKSKNPNVIEYNFKSMVQE